MTGTEIEPEAAVRSEPPPTEIDRSLALAASRGDDSAFARIYERHRAAIYRYCASMLGEHDAADALQATMTKALVALRDGDPPRDLRPWLYRIAHNESIDLIRERRSRSALGDVVEQESGTSASVAPSPAEQSEDRQRLEALIVDIRSLPERQRSAILMRELSGLSTGDIAAALETSESTAKQAVYEARVALTEIREGREMPCEPVQRALSDGDGRVLRGRQVRAHLRTCERCRAFAAAIDDRSRTLNSFTPVLPAALAAGILQQVLGAGAASGGAGAVAAGSGAAAAGAGAAGAGGTAVLAGGAAKLAAIAAATLAIGAGGYGGLKATGVIGGGEGRSADSGAAGPAEPGAGGSELGSDDPTEDGSGSIEGSPDTGDGAATARASDDAPGADVGATTEDARDSRGAESGVGTGSSGEDASDSAGRGAGGSDELPEAAADGQEQAESSRPDHAGRPADPGSRAGENDRGSERSAGGRERAEQGGNGSSGSNRGGNSATAGDRGRGPNADEGRGGGRGSSGERGGSGGRSDDAAPERQNGTNGGGRDAEREPRTDHEPRPERDTTASGSGGERQARGERPS
ncbi:sigma-70 family RNA polymerase sigma factor [Thermoleophilia bacterium SCSIO 60948]|nr:sigma-70 family RNA polymerase sigma factor [Thermoleophilia bacterium SCSIO 60948]